MPEEKLRKNLNLKLEDERYFVLRDRGVLFLDDEIDDGAFAKLSRDLIYLITGSFGEKIKLKKQPIWILLNSPGGDVLQGFAIYDLIKGLVNKGVTINILAIGMVASMATAILQAATKRFALPNTQFLVHQISKFTFFESEEVNKAEENLKVLQDWNKRAVAIIADRCGIGLEALLKVSKKTDCWFNAKEARMLGSNGLVDEITVELPFLIF